MTGTSDYHPPAPGNDNENPLRYADTGLDELYRWRRLWLDRDLSGLSLEEWRRHRDALKRVDEVIRLYLAYL
jgi:hypothetical protein